MWNTRYRILFALVAIVLGGWIVQAISAEPQKGALRAERTMPALDGPTERGKAIPFRVLLNGKPPGPAHGTGVDAEGRGMPGQRT